MSVEIVNQTEQNGALKSSAQGEEDASPAKVSNESGAATNEEEGATANISKASRRTCTTCGMAGQHACLCDSLVPVGEKRVRRPNSMIGDIPDTVKKPVAEGEGVEESSTSSSPSGKQAEGKKKKKKKQTETNNGVLNSLSSESDNDASGSDDITSSDEEGDAAPKAPKGSTGKSSASSPTGVSTIEQMLAKAAAAAKQRREKKEKEEADAKVKAEAELNKQQLEEKKALAHTEGNEVPKNKTDDEAAATAAHEDQVAVFEIPAPPPPPPITDAVEKDEADARSALYEVEHKYFDLILTQMKLEEQSKVYLRYLMLQAPPGSAAAGCASSDAQGNGKTEGDDHPAAAAAEVNNPFAPSTSSSSTTTASPHDSIILQLITSVSSGNFHKAKKVLRTSLRDVKKLAKLQYKINNPLTNGVKPPKKIGNVTGAKKSKSHHKKLTGDLSFVADQKVEASKNAAAEKKESKKQLRDDANAVANDILTMIFKENLQIVQSNEEMVRFLDESRRPFFKRTVVIEEKEQRELKKKKEAEEKVARAEKREQERLQREADKKAAAEAKAAAAAVTPADGAADAEGGAKTTAAPAGKKPEGKAIDKVKKQNQEAAKGMMKIEAFFTKKSTIPAEVQVQAPTSATVSRRLDGLFADSSPEEGDKTSTSDSPQDEKKSGGVAATGATSSKPAAAAPSRPDPASCFFRPYAHVHKDIKIQENYFGLWNKPLPDETCGFNLFDAATAAEKREGDDTPSVSSHPLFVAIEKPAEDVGPFSATTEMKDVNPFQLQRGIFEQRREKEARVQENLHRMGTEPMNFSSTTPLAGGGNHTTTEFLAVEDERTYDADQQKLEYNQMESAALKPHGVERLPVAFDAFVDTKNHCEIGVPDMNPEVLLVAWFSQQWERMYSRPAYFGSWNSKLPQHLKLSRLMRFKSQEEISRLSAEEIQQYLQLSVDDDEFLYSDDSGDDWDENPSDDDGDDIDDASVSDIGSDDEVSSDGKEFIDDNSEDLDDEEREYREEMRRKQKMRTSMLVASCELNAVHARTHFIRELTKEEKSNKADCALPSDESLASVTWNRLNPSAFLNLFPKELVDPVGAAKDKAEAAAAGEGQVKKKKKIIKKKVVSAAAAVPAGATVNPADAASTVVNDAAGVATTADLPQVVDGPVSVTMMQSSAGDVTGVVPSSSSQPVAVAAAVSTSEGAEADGTTNLVAAAPVPEVVAGAEKKPKKPRQPVEKTEKCQYCEKMFSKGGIKNHLKKCTKAPAASGAATTTAVNQPKITLAMAAAPKVAPKTESSENSGSAVEGAKFFSPVETLAMEAAPTTSSSSRVVAPAAPIVTSGGTPTVQDPAASVGKKRSRSRVETEDVVVAATAPRSSSKANKQDQLGPATGGDDGAAETSKSVAALLSADQNKSSLNVAATPEPSGKKFNTPSSKRNREDEDEAKTDELSPKQHQEVALAASTGKKRAQSKARSKSAIDLTQDQ